MLKKTISVDVISSCVCRDCFELGLKELTNNNYKVEFFYQATSPFSLYSAPHKELQGLCEQDLAFGSPWEKRIFLCDVKKNMFEKIGSEKRQNYLVLDFTDFAKNLYSLVADDSSYLIQTEPSKKNINSFNKHVREIVEPWNLPSEYIYYCLEKYVTDFLKIYNDEKIILCKIYHVKKYLSSNGIINDFVSQVDKQNEFLEMCYNHIENEFIKRGAKIHIVEMPKGVLGDETHKWGKYTLHFCKELYEYLLEAVDIICSSYDDEEQMLKTNLKRFESIFNTIFQGAERLKKIHELEALTKNEKKQKQLAGVEIEKLSVALNEEQQMVQKLEDSASYKIGRFFTFIPRKIFKRNNKKQK